jgi:hypothetical protein
MTQAVKVRARKRQKTREKVDRLAKENEEEAKTKEAKCLAKANNERGGRQASLSHDRDGVSQYILKILLASTERIIGNLANVLVAWAGPPATTTPAGSKNVFNG